MAEHKLSLPEDVSKAFKLKKGSPLKSYNKKFGEVDLTKITPAQAEDLVKKGYPNLEKINKKEPPAVGQ